MSILKSFVFSLSLALSAAPALAEGTFADGTPYKGSWQSSIIPNMGMAMGAGQYFVYKPKVVKRKSLAVMLHGCAYSSIPAEDFLRSSGMMERADREGFIVLLPQESDKINAGRCWNWFLTPNYSYRADLFPLLPANEPGLVLQMIDTVALTNGLDRSRVFAMGMSAGGSMAANLASCYPDRFKAFGIHSGNQYRGAALLALDYRNYTDLEVFKKALIEMILKPDDQHMEKIEESAEMAAVCAGVVGKPIKAILFHGTKDPMPTGHSDRLLAQLMATDDYFDNGRRDNSTRFVKTTEEVKGAAPGKYDYIVNQVKDKKGELIFAQYIIKEMGHGWSGGDNRWQFNDPDGPSATEIMMDFFKKNGF